MIPCKFRLVGKARSMVLFFSAEKTGVGYVEGIVFLPRLIVSKLMRKCLRWNQG